MRQDTPGTRFEVSTHPAEEEAHEAMATFEAGYRHRQTYYEHRSGAEEPEQPPTSASQVWHSLAVNSEQRRKRVELPTLIRFGPSPGSW